MSNIKSWLENSCLFNKQITEYCKPLENLLGITRFSFCQIDNTGQGILLHSYPKQLEYYLNQKHYLYDPHIVHPDNILTGAALWASYDDLNYQGVVLPSSERLFQSYYGLSYIRKNNTDFCAYLFSTYEQNHGIFSSYYNYFEQIELFINFFDAQLQGIVEDLQNAKVDLHKLKGERFTNQPGITQGTITKKQQEEFLALLN